MNKSGVRKKTRLVFGVGENDANYPVRQDGVRCPKYLVWKSMLGRCYSEAIIARQPSYKGCSVDIRWHRFSVFNDWMSAQEWNGMQLDKDLLVSGNKIYSPETCVFIPKVLNSFLTDCAASRGEFMLGVSLNRSTGKFIAQCCDPLGERPMYIGSFWSELDAHEAWRKRKHEYALRFASVQKDQRVASAISTRYL